MHTHCPLEQAFRELASLLELEEPEDVFKADAIVKDTPFHVLKYHGEIFLCAILNQ